MLLSDRDIRRAMSAGKIEIEPRDGFDARLGPDSVDFRLGDNFLVFERTEQVLETFTGQQE